MNTYELSKKAEEDIEGISFYTLKTWGERQAIKYLDEL